MPDSVSRIPPRDVRDTDTSNNGVPLSELERRLRIMRGLGNNVEGALHGAVLDGHLTTAQADRLARAVK